MALNFMYAFYFAFMICCFVIVPVYGLHKISRMYPSSRQHRRSKYGWSRFKTLLKAYSIVLLILLGAALPHIGKLVDDLSADLEHGRESTFWLKVLTYVSYFVLPLLLALAVDVYRNRLGSNSSRS